LRYILRYAFREFIILPFWILLSPLYLPDQMNPGVLTQIYTTNQLRVDGLSNPQGIYNYLQGQLYRHIVNTIVVFIPLSFLCKGFFMHGRMEPYQLILFVSRVTPIIDIISRQKDLPSYMGYIRDMLR